MKQAHRQTTQTQNNGTVWMAYTDSQHEVAVWKPGNTATANNAALIKKVHNAVTQQAHFLMGRFSNDSASYRGEVFCHGHSLGTFAQFGYCVLGGPPMETVLADEYVEKNINEVKAGDIIVWRKMANAQMQIVHSAILEIVPATPTVNNIKISSKDTFAGFSHEILNKYLKSWGNAYKFYRKR